MAFADRLPRPRLAGDVLRRLARAIALRRRGEATDAPAGSERGCPLALDPATLYDIGACPAYRDYATAARIDGGAERRLQRLTDSARWSIPQ